MSHQPSTLDNVRTAASNATQAVTDVLDPNIDSGATQKKDANINIDEQGVPVEQGSYKDQLNDAARGNFAPPKEETVVEKAAAYIPGLSTVMGKGKEETTDNEGVVNDGSPPQRPEHDVQVEEFIKEQYKSTSESGLVKEK